MATPSTTARFKAAVQASQGTAKTTGFICGMLTRSTLRPQFDIADKGAEHGCGGADRATVHRSPSVRSSYLAIGQARGYLYPDFIGVLLAGAGFTPVTTGAGADKTHTFKLSTRSAVKWLTILESMASNELRGTDVRVDQLSLEANPDGVTYDASLRGLKVDESLGTETSNNETTVEMLPSRGSLTMYYDPAGANEDQINTATDTLTRASVQIANPLSDDRSLWEFRRVDLAQRGIDVTGRIEGVEIDWETYERIVNGANNGTDPSPNTAICSVSLKWQSATNIPTAAVPYSLEIVVPRAEVTLDEFAADGDSLVRWNYNWRMIDNTTDPIVITLINGVTSY